MPKRIAVLLDYSFDDSEYSETIEAFRAARHAITNIENRAGKIIHGKKCRYSVTVDCSIDEVSALEFDALLILGDHPPSKLRADGRYIDFIRHFANLHKPILCTCHAPLLFIDASIVKGRRLTTYGGTEKDLIDAGAVFLDQAVVNDNNLYITSRSHLDLPAFISESLNVLRQ